jgi:hypothetical protein
MDGGTVHIFGGAIPVDADAAETGTLLMKLTKDGATHTPGSSVNGLVMGTSTAGVLSKNGDTWSGVGLAAAGAEGILATYYRWYDVDVVTGLSTTAKRVDGAIGTSTAFEMRMIGSTLIVEGAPATVNTFTFTTKQA